MTASDSMLSAHPVKPKIRPLIDNGDGTHSVPTNKPGVMALIDSADAEVVGRYCWYVHKSSHREYIATMFYCQGEKQRVKLHHVIAGKPIFKRETDHVNRDSLDNRRRNLRCVTRQENSCNRSVRSSTGFLGVYPAYRGGRFRAIIEIKNKPISLGVRDTAEAAARLYDAARELLGHDPLYGNHLPLTLEDYYQASSGMAA